ncbi:hypothetical protein EHW64_13720 [Erwinia psidii]|uniref:hypothetical protein n=1 Tax=Erwinia psidii TaxID=69224 RepID=UPI00226B9499|nr:hypothetical protein [Erwinia psidii]MCX8962161.1 hypothetical protein [Erwinia psidii]
MKITKQQWDVVEQSIKSGAGASFDYQGRKIEVHKIQTGETRMAYIITLDGDILWGYFREGNPSYQPLAEVFLRKKMVNPYAKVARDIAKEHGGKAYLRKKDNRYLTEKNHEVTETYFPTARTVVNHFRRIEGLTLRPAVSFPQEDKPCI